MRFVVGRFVVGVIMCVLFLAVHLAEGGTVSTTYTDLAYGTTTDLTATGTHDWVKYGVGGGGLGWTATRKAGVTPIISSSLTELGSGPAGTSVVLTSFAGGAIQLFDWTDGDSPVSATDDSIVTETILPAQFDYPLGLGAALTAGATAGTRALDVYVQGFNADMMITASLSGGGSDSVVVSPKVTRPPSDPNNNYSTGVFSVLYSGAGETLTVSVTAVAPKQPGSVGFPNAGFFAAALGGPSLTGDISMDGRVDIGDFTLWGDAFGATGSAMIEDISGDGRVDIGDFTLWGDNFGATAGPSGAPGSSPNAVPEPASIVLFGIGMLSFAMFGLRFKYKA